MKKIISVLAAVALMMTATVAAFACGRNISYPVCEIESCVIVKNHIHNGKIYCSHFYDDGHDYHEYCDVANCRLSGYHRHGNEYCFSYSNNTANSNYSRRGHCR